MMPMFHVETVYNEAVDSDQEHRRTVWFVEENLEY